MFFCLLGETKNQSSIFPINDSSSIITLKNRVRKKIDANIITNDKENFDI